MGDQDIFKCDGCGGVMVWDPRSYSFKCPNCDAVRDLQPDRSKVTENPLTYKKLKTIKASVGTVGTMECTGCGAVIEIQSTETGKECPYCGASYVLSSKQVENIKPDGIVPFAIDKPTLQRNFDAWIKSLKLAPGALKTLYQQDKFQGIYIPVWTFDAETDTSYTAEGGTKIKKTVRDEQGNTKTVTETQWSPTSGRVHVSFDDVVVPATDKIKKKFLDKSPYDMNKIVDYKPEYTSGFMSETFTVDMDKGHDTAISAMKAEISNVCRADVRSRYDDVRNVRISPTFSDEMYKYVLVPAYMTAYNFNGKIYNVFINGETGEVSGDSPKSKLKIAVIIAAVILVLILIKVFSN